MDKTHRQESSQKPPTKLMERPRAKPQPHHELTQDRYEEGSNSEVAGHYASTRSDQNVANSRDSDEAKEG
jgi:hypothetical protein